jgi:transposase
VPADGVRGSNRCRNWHQSLEEAPTSQLTPLDGINEHVWRLTRRGDKYVTVIIDLTPIRDRTGPAPLLDMVEGRSKQAFTTWLAEGDEPWRNGIEVVAMDGFTGFKTPGAGRTCRPR